MEFLLHGFLRRCVLMRCLWVVDLHAHVVEKALHGVGRGPLRAHVCASSDQHGLKIGEEDGSHSAFPLHRCRACGLHAGVLFREPLRLLGFLVLTQLLRKSRVFKLRLPLGGAFNSQALWLLGPAARS